jgi:NDP-sugar pyrophosphorylase family protein
VIDPYTSVQSGTEIIGSEIGNSIVMADCRIENARGVRDSLLGRNVRVVRTDSGSSSIQLMVGDNCAIGLP